MPQLADGAVPEAWGVSGNDAALRSGLVNKSQTNVASGVLPSPSAGLRHNHCLGPLNHYLGSSLQYLHGWKWPVGLWGLFEKEKSVAAASCASACTRLPAHTAPEKPRLGFKLAPSSLAEPSGAAKQAE